jgi:hypothetical protein
MAAGGSGFNVNCIYFTSLLRIAPETIGSLRPYLLIVVVFVALHVACGIPNSES